MTTLTIGRRQGLSTSHGGIGKGLAIHISDGRPTGKKQKDARKDFFHDAVNVQFFLTSQDSCIFILMKTIPVLLLLLAALLGGCERKPSTADDVKDNLIKAMTQKLEKDRPANAPPFHFQILDVAYFPIGLWYRCEFKVKLTRPNGTDTTGMIKSKISKDYSEVIK